MSSSLYKKQLDSNWYQKFGQRREKTNTHKLKQLEKKYQKAYDLIISIQKTAKCISIHDNEFRYNVNEAIDLWKLDNQPSKENNEYTNI